MVKFSKATILSGVAAFVVAILGAVLIMSQPALSKNDRQSGASDGVITTLGF